MVFLGDEGHGDGQGSTVHVVDDHGDDQHRQDRPAVVLFLVHVESPAGIWSMPIIVFLVFVRSARRTFFLRTPV
ncbi:hypothetical protein D3C87_2023060 [compost metagenome]